MRGSIEALSKIVVRFIDRGHPGYALAALALILFTVMMTGVLIYHSGSAGGTAIVKQIWQTR